MSTQSRSASVAGKTGITQAPRLSQEPPNVAAKISLYDIRPPARPTNKEFDDFWRAPPKAPVAKDNNTDPYDPSLIGEFGPPKVVRSRELINPKKGGGIKKKRRTNRR